MCVQFRVFESWITNLCMTYHNKQIRKFGLIFFSPSLQRVLCQTEMEYLEFGCMELSTNQRHIELRILISNILSQSGERSILIFLVEMARFTLSPQRVLCPKGIIWSGLSHLELNTSSIQTELRIKICPCLWTLRRNDPRKFWVKRSGNIFYWSWLYQIKVSIYFQAKMKLLKQTKKKLGHWLEGT